MLNYFLIVFLWKHADVFDCATFRCFLSVFCMSTVCQVKRYILVSLDGILNLTDENKVLRDRQAYLQWHALYKGPRSHNFHKKTSVVFVYWKFFPFLVGLNNSTNKQNKKQLSYLNMLLQIWWWTVEAETCDCCMKTNLIGFGGLEGTAYGMNCCDMVQLSLGDEWHLPEPAMLNRI